MCWEVSRGPPRTASVYKLDAKTGSYVPWDDKDTVDLEMKTVLDAPAPGDGKNAPPVKADGIDARGGHLYLSFAGANTIAMLDAKTGRVLKKLPVPAPRYMKSVSDSLLYAVARGKGWWRSTPDRPCKEFCRRLQRGDGFGGRSAGNVYVAERNGQSGAGL